MYPAEHYTQNCMLTWRERRDVEEAELCAEGRQLHEQRERLANTARSAYDGRLAGLVTKHQAACGPHGRRQGVDDIAEELRHSGSQHEGCADLRQEAGRARSRRLRTRQYT